MIPWWEEDLPEETDTLPVYGMWTFPSGEKLWITAPFFVPLEPGSYQSGLEAYLQYQAGGGAGAAGLQDLLGNRPQFTPPDMQRAHELQQLMERAAAWRQAQARGMVGQIPAPTLPATERATGRPTTWEQIQQLMGTIGTRPDRERGR